MIDGVIKYHVEHRYSAAPVFETFTPLEALRARLFALGLIGEQDGIGYGNLSQRIPQSRIFFITATQTGKAAALSQEQYTLVDDYDFKRFTVFSKGVCKPSSEALTHAMIYELDARIGTVIHIHSKPLWNFMQQVGWLATTAAYGTSAMVDEVATLYQQHEVFPNNAFVMQGHEDGIITFGRTIQEAELKLYAIVQDYLTGEASKG